MNSIDKEQQQDTKKDLSGKEAAAKIKELADTAGSCFFCTNLQKGKAVTTRPMAVLQVDEAGALWFMSANDSHKNAEIKADPNIQLFFQGSSHSDFMSLYGKATISTDKAKIKELWNPMIKNWFTGGIDDPRITVIKFDLETGHYWDTKHGMIVEFVQEVLGALTGKTMDDSVEGMLKS